MGTVYTVSYPAPHVDLKEILRYAGAASDATELLPLVSSAVDEAADKLAYKVCYTELPIGIFEDEIYLGFVRVRSSALTKKLVGCEKIILFAATVGIGIDRLIKMSVVTSPAMALAFQALGAERVEALCDSFCNDIKKRYNELGYTTTTRISPGYADIPLLLQKDIFAVLECQKRIGLTLNESLLMSPTKSVTAIVGVKKQTNDY